MEKLCTTLDTLTRNSDQKNAYEVFFEANDQTRSQAKEWMSENAKNCSIVAVLIATVAFTSAYTVPGGPDKSGHPVLRDQPMFLLFTLADAISLSTALTSVIIFMNIVTSTFNFDDFASSLYEKQLTALILLIISVTMMMVAFAATLVLTITSEATWSNMTLYGVSFFPVIVFMYTYIPEYMTIVKDMFRVLKKMMGKIYNIIWDNKPQSTHVIDGTLNSTSHSPV